MTIGLLCTTCRFNTQPRGGGCQGSVKIEFTLKVSTHSRAKAAANISADIIAFFTCFNTQPRGGGCQGSVKIEFTLKVSTHSRAEAAANAFAETAIAGNLFQHTATRRWLRKQKPKWTACKMFQHTAARRRLHDSFHAAKNWLKFQHTAARRRLRQGAATR